MNLTTLLNAANNATKFGEGIENAEIGEKIVFSLQVVLIGMGVVFGVLLLLIGILQVFKLFAVKPAKKENAGPIAAPAPAVAPAPADVASSSNEEEKIVAIATAAIAASRGKSEVDFNVISIAPIGQATNNVTPPAASEAPVAAPVAAPVPAVEDVNEEKTVSLSNASKVVSGDGEKVNAPLPGNILDVKVVTGASVKKGDILCILEAMKMENEIVAPIDGKVVTVAATKGASVNTGDLLFVIG